MRKILKGTLLVLLLLFVIIQFVRPVRSNPNVNSAREITTVHSMTPEVSSALQNSCNDCHSNKTVWPWYSNVAPVSWIVARDVSHGRAALNFSEWGAYNGEKRQELIGKICEEVRDGEMPMPQYTLLHPGTRLNASQAQAVCSWSQEVAPGKMAEEREEERGEDD